MSWFLKWFPTPVTKSVSLQKWICLWAGCVENVFCLFCLCTFLNYGCFWSCGYSVKYIFIKRIVIVFWYQSYIFWSNFYANIYEKAVKILIPVDYAVTSVSIINNNVSVTIRLPALPLGLCVTLFTFSTVKDRFIVMDFH